MKTALQWLQEALNEAATTKVVWAQMEWYNVDTKRYEFVNLPPGYTQDMVAGFNTALAEKDWDDIAGTVMLEDKTWIVFTENEGGYNYFDIIKVPEYEW